ncbi:MAG TPA: hypothetical protein VEW65_10125 [Chryseolinea sp.]|nr:hypothetical protein [Chryseolinea sp.]
MTIKTSEFWTDEPFEDIVKKIKSETRLVEFGMFNSFPKSFARYPLLWVGEINESTQSFKLFRVRSTESTSDISIVGKYTTRNGKSVIVVKHKLHFTTLFGMVGLLILAIAVFFFLQKKDIVIPVVLQALALALVILFYAFTILKDLQKGEKAIMAVLTKALVNAQEADDRSEKIEDVED